MRVTLFRTRTVLSLVAAVTLLYAQQPPRVPPGFGPVAVPQPKPEAPPPAQAKPPAPAGQQPPAAAQPGAPAQPVTAPGGLNLQNASLVEVVDILARQLKINYILDPRVRGGVILNTYGETKQLDTKSLLDMVLRINGFAMVQVGEIYRVVPMSEVSRLPLRPQINAKDITESEQVLLNLVFLKYAQVEELAKLLDPFIGENAKTWAYPPANLLLILDSARSMKRTMELVSLFDSDALAGQRVRLFEVKHSRPSDIAKELDNIFKSISLTEKASPIKFLPVDRINTVVAVASNPGAFEEVERWLKKLDVAVKVTAGSIDNYVYRVKYQQAQALAAAIMMLYGGYGYGMGMYGMGFGSLGGMFGGYGGGFGGYGGMGGMGGYPGMMGGFSPYGQMGMYPGGGFYGAGAPIYQTTATPIPFNTPPTVGGGSTAVNPNAPPQGEVAGPGLTGQYLGAAAAGGQQGRIPHVVPNPFDNSLLIQGTAQEYEGILKLLRQLDIPPRQVLIDARIYEVSLTGAFASGVAAFLSSKNSSAVADRPDTRLAVGNLANGALNLTAGALVGQSRELLAFLQLTENETRAKVVSAPSVIATDSIAASINVGTEVPTLTAQSATGVTTGGNSLFAQQISNRNSGVTLAITARVNPSGIVTLIINQEVSAPQAPASGGIQSPSFSKRSIQTQVTVQDGDTIAIGGIINETSSQASSGIPFLHRIPYIGYAFGSKSLSRERTELIVFMTPRVIYDTTEILDASDELKSRLKMLTKVVKE